MAADQVGQFRAACVNPIRARVAQAFRLERAIGGSNYNYLSAAYGRPSLLERF